MTTTELLQLATAVVFGTLLLATAWWLRRRR